MHTGGMYLQRQEMNDDEVCCVRVQFFISFLFFLFHHLLTFLPLSLSLFDLSLSALLNTILM